MRKQMGHLVCEGVLFFFFNTSLFLHSSTNLPPTPRPASYSVFLQDLFWLLLNWPFMFKKIWSLEKKEGEKEREREKVIRKMRKWIKDISGERDF